jgi:hypothetical protein
MLTEFEPQRLLDHPVDGDDSAVLTIQLGTPRGRYNEHMSKFLSV